MESTQRSWTSFFVATKSNREQIQDIIKNGYEFEHDRAVIIASISLEYKIKPSEVDDLDVDDIYRMMAALSGDSKFYHLIYIRTETNQDHIKNFTKAEMKERESWKSFVNELKQEYMSKNELHEEYRKRTTSFMDRMMAQYSSK